MPLLIKKNSLLFIHLFISFLAFAQLPESTIKKIDAIFSQWDKPNSPGFAIGIVQDDKLVFKKGYGMANLEYSIPNEANSVYHMASVSKQFTAFSILLLEKQGKLKLDDDIRKHLTWFPDLKEKITIQHLLNHTSGIRDQWELVVLSGIRIDDVITQDYIINLLSRQQGLNFKPGEQFLYSNSNYLLMAEIVKAVSKKSFRDFANSEIFKPLGMESTHIHDRHNELVPNRAYSYRPATFGGYENAVLNYANSGATSLFTTVNDMSKWVVNFYHNIVGDASTFKSFATKNKLNNGKENNYAAGITVADFNGQLMYSHSGGDAGYRTYLSVFPEKKMGFIIFANLSNINPVTKGSELMELFFPKLTGITAGTSSKPDTALTFLADTIDLSKRMGNYISEDGARFSFHLKNSQAFWKSSVATYTLAKIENDTLLSYQNPEVKFVFSNNKSNQMIVDQYWPGNHRQLVKYNLPTTDTFQLDKELKPYVGTYYSPELDVKYIVALENHKLRLKGGNMRTIDDLLEYVRTDQFNLNNSKIVFKKGKEDSVESMEISTGRVKNLVFLKK